ncbi:MAG TPA: ribonuclease III [Paludibacter sp.]|nr:ribonuclease III [Paludibacter sp.]
MGFYPARIGYYQLAVQHKSVPAISPDGIPLSNERLEFLGDAVLNSVVADILYHRYENQQEGFLTNMRSKIVKRDSLNRLAVEIGLDKLVKVTKHVNAHANHNIYGNALEALIGAIYLDLGYGKCKQFVERRLFGSFVNLDKVAESEMNFKSKLIEWVQKRQLAIEFLLVDEVLEAGNKHVFKTRLLIEGVAVCEAAGSSKKESQQNASRLACQRIIAEPDFQQEIILARTETFAGSGHVPGQSLATRLPH